MPAWVWRGGKFVYKHRKKIRRAVSFDKTRRRAIKYRRKQIQESRGSPSMQSSGRDTKSRKTIRAPVANMRNYSKTKDWDAIQSGNISNKRRKAARRRTKASRTYTAEERARYWRKKYFDLLELVK